MSSEWIHFLILGFYLVSKSDAIRCFTCGEDEGDSFSCSKFQIEDPRFAKECGSSSKSCRLSRKVNENIVMSRSCEVVPLDDCKTLASTEYCYCTTDLCNTINPSDDEEEEEFIEDSIEGSGTKNTDMDIPTETKSSNQDITVSTKKNIDNVDLHESVDTNAISTSCSSFCQSIWCLVVSTFLIHFIHLH